MAGCQGDIIPTPDMVPAQAVRIDHLQVSPRTYWLSQGGHIYNNTCMHVCTGAFGSRFEFLEFKPHTCHTAAVLVQLGPEQSPVLKPLARSLLPLYLSGTT